MARPSTIRNLGDVKYRYGKPILYRCTCSCGCIKRWAAYPPKLPPGWKHLKDDTYLCPGCIRERQNK